MSAPTIDRSTCSAPRHGTIAALRHNGCTCPDSREQRRLYDKRRSLGRPERRREPALGISRRIQALWAIGHNSATIGAHANMHPQEVQQLAKHRDWVTPATAADVHRAYRNLKDIPGTSDTTARRAAAAGYKPPPYWDAGDDIDLPDPEPDPDLVDDVLVEQALHRVIYGGGTAAGLNRAERAEFARAAHNAGLTITRIAEVIGANNGTVRKYLGGER
jgi:hypothetical protein